jgi:hypothetical protein
MDEFIKGRGSPPGPHVLFSRGRMMFRDLFRIDELARHIGDDMATGLPSGGRSSLDTGNLRFFRSLVRRLDLASSSVPLRASARFRRSSGSDRFAASSIVSQRC